MIAMAVVCLVKGQYVVDMITKTPGLPDGVLIIGACIAVCAAASMNDLTAPSISLEERIFGSCVRFQSHRGRYLGQN